MEERFLKERYVEWSGAFSYKHPATIHGEKLLDIANKLSDEMSDDLIKNHGCPEMIADMFLDSGNDYLKAGFYAGYEMACYMFHNMIQDSPLSKSDHDRWNSIVTLSNVNQYYQKHGRMPNTFEELNQWIKDRGETNHEHA